MRRIKVLVSMCFFAIVILNFVPVYAETTEETETVAIVETEESETESETTSDVTHDVLNISINFEEVEPGTKQSITVQMNHTQNIKNATLIAFAEDKGAEVRYNSTSISDTEIVFEIDYSLEQADTYKIIALEIQTEEELKNYSLSEFGDLSYLVTGFDKGVLMNSGISLFSVNQFTGVNGDDGVFVIVLDPGHDPGCNTRGWVNGVWETQLNWKIAEAMKAELEGYSGVEVYINRTWEECPEKTDGMECLKARVTRAAKLKADLVISIHNNGIGSGSLQNYVRGSEAFVTRYPSYNGEAKGLAELMLSKLEEMGIRNNGVKTRYYGDDATDTYDDGTGWDYYAITRYSTLMGIPSVLIEHAYMDNSYDLSILRDDAKLKEIGRKDAQAIIEYYGLQFITEPSGDLIITQTVDNYVDVKINNAEAPFSIKGVKVCIHPESGGGENAKWYDAVLEGRTWKTSINMKNQNMGEGRYTTQVYFVDTEGKNRFVKEVSFDFVSDENVSADISVAKKNADTGDFLIKVTNITVPYGIGKVQLEVWPEKKGREYAVFYETQKKNNEWTVNVKGTDHGKTPGTYRIELWITDSNGTAHEVKSFSTEIAINPAIVSMYRMYNPNSGEHFYTSDINEKKHLVKVGWNYEGIGWYAPETGHPVYRLYNPNVGDHHYTLDINEKNHLVDVGWNYEGIGWYSDIEEKVPLYRLYNPNAVTGTHHYTTDINESNYLDKIGWNYEGIAWYGVLPR